LDRCANHLLSALSQPGFDLIAPHLQEVETPQRTVVEGAAIPIEFVYFPLAGLMSTVAISQEGERTEVGLFGFDGMTGGALVNGSDRSPLETFVQVSGRSLRISAEHMRGALEASPELKGMCLLANEARGIQISYTALSNVRHTIEERLARWLLMSHDRATSDELQLTHEFLALMLGVRRAGVTTALHILEGALIIRATRGQIHVRDRNKLRDVAGDAYGIPEAEYLRLFGRSI
jgi:CRP-like cAMP-binding protein